jgi:A/G-specific adenine glycosylase
MKKTFTRILLDWHQTENNREMPWKGEQDPYKIWLSEIILQQTRVAQGLAYYEKFVATFPTIKDLANTEDQVAFKMCEGLGYYNRCKNLLHTARHIVLHLNGKFPNTYEHILTLKGVGPYTAAAIASFAFQLPHAVVDGNVFRVLSRVFGIATPIDSTQGKIAFSELANQLLDRGSPGEFNQAMMDFGATVCKPFSPSCMHCPLMHQCKAFKQGQVNSLPIKEKQLSKKRRWFNYFIFEHQHAILVHKRIAKDIWENLFEFYLVEAPELVIWDNQRVLDFLKDQLGIQSAVTKAISGVAIQQLTHQQIKAQFIVVKLLNKPKCFSTMQWQAVKAINDLPFPKMITQFLEKQPLLDL